MTLAQQDLVPSTITAGQIAIFAANVNDRRVIEEARQLCADLEVDPELVSAISYEPAVGRGSARLLFECYSVNDKGKRFVVNPDGTPYDAAGGGMAIAATYVNTKQFRGPLPTWWSQVARTAAPTIIPED